mmetsp:Transcript_31213/g.56552  ORF Transcript_31213/g.56552 Transcript_31213/m.56552 type:complete len:171 (-) Transcript_31213:174-686(-)|eukprot:CAMPEP_0202480606 /NCGR_PEP_ID=MMETSP1361-20130828/523_1 /ASSEMBLY_ACC=CAM_ASM_000849 /TAXON_ID=210615 /ORGANISM="Staurosira complex sp., Strain CCMP2646" /LENGTH=170 /DNA_ID=CAMNT_0049108051 /DNA_START=81 /DNA_END=593 /DNA_ORIENTATION=+
MTIPSSIALFLAVTSGVGAFCPHHAAPSSRSVTELQASKNEWLSPVAAAVIGWTLAAQVSGAGILPANEQMPSFQGESTTLLAAETIDFSLPSYSADMQGFGQGAEARLSEAKGGNEAEKQKEAMRKAEAARQARLLEKKAEAKAREEEALAREKAKKEAQKDRFKEIFQ